MQGIAGAVKLKSRLVGKTGHADPAFFGLQNSCFAQTGSIQYKVVVVGSADLSLFVFGCDIFSNLF